MKLKILNLENNRELQCLSCYDNKLTTLNLENNKKIGNII